MRYFNRSLAVLAIVFLVGVLPASAHAASATFFGPIVPPECNCTDQPNPGGGTITTAPSYGCVLATVQNTVNFGISIGIIAATLAFVYAGFVFMISSGNPEGRGKARGMLINVAIGLVVLLSAWLIVDFIMKRLYAGDNGSAVYMPWNSILSDTKPEDQCIVAKKPTPIAGSLGKALTTEMGGQGNQLAPVSPTTSGGTGANCPAADPATMAPFPTAATSGGAEKATQTTVNNFLLMRAAALQDGIELRVTDGYRSDAEQVQLWNQYNHDTSQVAKPCSLGGNGSNHNSGTAVDIAVGCAKTNSSCSSPAFLWLKAHGSQWGFRNALPTDVVHWSPTGR